MQKKKAISYSLYILLLMILCASCSGVQKTSGSQPNESNHLSQFNSQMSHPIVLYSLPDSIFQLPKTQIPYYQAGEIAFLSQQEFDSLKNGHSPWKSNPLMVVEVLCSNLFGVERTADLINHATRTTNEIKYNNGIDIKLVKEQKPQSTVQLFAPKMGSYTVTLQAPSGTDMLFIQKIVFDPIHS